MRSGGNENPYGQAEMVLMELHRKLLDFYAKHKPANLDEDVLTIVMQFYIDAGEEALNEKLRKRYGEDLNTFKKVEINFSLPPALTNPSRTSATLGRMSRQKSVKDLEDMGLGHQRPQSKRKTTATRESIGVENKTKSKETRGTRVRGSFMEFSPKKNKKENKDPELLAFKKENDYENLVDQFFDTTDEVPEEEIPPELLPSPKMTLKSKPSPPKSPPPEFNLPEPKISSLPEPKIKKSASKKTSVPSTSPKLASTPPKMSSKPFPPKSLPEPKKSQLKEKNQSNLRPQLKLQSKEKQKLKPQPPSSAPPPVKSSSKPSPTAVPEVFLITKDKSKQLYLLDSNVTLSNKDYLEAFYSVHDEEKLDDDRQLEKFLTWIEQNSLEALSKKLREKYGEGFEETRILATRRRNLEDLLTRYYVKYDPSKLNSRWTILKILNWTMKHGVKALNEKFVMRYGRPVVEADKNELLDIEELNL